MSNKKIGILALQGDFKEHRRALDSLDVENIEVRLPKDLKDLDGLILPGGESTTILKLMKIYNLYDLLIEKAKDGFPIYGTCAGTIVLSKESDKLTDKPFGVIDISVIRNAYGSQKYSFEEDIYIEKIGESVPGIFIRAPKINRVGENVDILGKAESGDVVIAQEDHILVSTFHPELSTSNVIHRYFIEKIVD